MFRITEYELINIGNNNYLLLNLINGCADLLDMKTAIMFDKNDFAKCDVNTVNKMLERRYLFYSEKEYDDFIKKYNLELRKSSLVEAPNFIYIPTFECNLDCYYCFEKAYEKSGKIYHDLNNDLDTFFHFCNSVREKIEDENNTSFADEDILITITGGEPLLKEHYNTIERILIWGYANNFSTTIVTNGTTLADYIPLFEKYPLKQLQITLDGSKVVHDAIRVGKHGEPTYDLIITNLGKLSKITDNILVRINITEKNISSINLLEETIREYPNVLFYTYLMQQEGCSDDDNTIEEVVGLKYLWEIKAKNGNLDNLIIEYHGKDYIDSIFEGTDFNPQLKKCSAMQNQYIIDSKGCLYKCWWGMGNADYSIGHIDKTGCVIDNDMLNLYLHRNVDELKKCRTCKYRYICGGACSGRLTKRQLQEGQVMCPDFRSIFQFVMPQKMLEMQEQYAEYDTE